MTPADKPNIRWRGHAGVREPRNTTPLRGFLDYRDRDLIEGSARNPEFPEAPISVPV
jgi:hypothetical protein